MEKRKIETVALAYFSGTGGTEAIVKCFASQFSKAGIRINQIDISCYDSANQEEKSDLLMIFSPVYAFRLSSIVERWVKDLSKVSNTFAAVISVSGGGEVSPNTACRVRCKQLLRARGYQLIYEKMLIMPSNFGSQAEEYLNGMLIKAVPHKVEKIVIDILSGEVNDTKPLLLDRFFSSVGKAEHFGAKIFGSCIRVSNKCNGCKLCAKKCPVKNIQMKEGIPRFRFRCIWCLKCIYACPQNALSPGILKFCVLKNGYNLKKMNEKANEQCDERHQMSKDGLWQGVIDYLKE